MGRDILFMREIGLKNLRHVADLTASQPIRFKNLLSIL
jgi:hypothetical protein